MISNYRGIKFGHELNHLVGVDFEGMLILFMFQGYLGVFFD